MSENKPDLERAIFAGAIAAGVVSLLPYVNIFLVTAYVVGALVAVWFAVKKQGQTLSYKEGAKLGFLSVFFGVTAAAAIFDLIWQISGYQLWQKQNAAMMLGLFRVFASASTVDTISVAMSQNAEKPFAWYVFLVQVIAGAIFAALFAMPSGLLGVKIFQRRSA
jgi:succinate dehydrogenase/fumarate reductase cytochrome b subunit